MSYEKPHRIFRETIGKMTDTQLRKIHDEMYDDQDLEQEVMESFFYRKPVDKNYWITRAIEILEDKNGNDSEPRKIQE